MSTQKISLLQKYDLPIDNLTYSFIDQCSNTKTLGRVIHVLRSEEEGSYPHLLSHAEERLRALMPNSRVLRICQPVLTNSSLDLLCRQELAEDFKRFTCDMKKQEDSMRSTVTKTNNLPAVRKSEPANLGEKKVEPCKMVKKSIPRDYSEWDKYDVDRELKKMEIEEEKEREVAVMRNMKKNVQNAVEEEAETMQQNLLCDMAEHERSYVEAREKEKGNECFRAGEYAAAAAYYTNCLQLAESVDAYNNRAMTYLKLQRYSEAIKDCNSVLEIDADNVKAYYRRSVAYLKLSNLIQARDDMARVVELQPDMEDTKIVLRRLEKQCASQKCRRIPITDIVSEDCTYHGNNAATRWNGKREASACKNITNRVGGCYGKENASSRPKIVELPNVETASPRPTSCIEDRDVGKPVTETTVTGIMPGRREVTGASGRTPLRENDNRYVNAGSAEVNNNYTFVRTQTKECTVDEVKNVSGLRAGVTTRLSREVHQHGKVCDVCVMEGKNSSYKCPWLCTPPKTPAKCIQNSWDANSYARRGAVFRSNSSIAAGRDEDDRITHASANQEDGQTEIGRYIRTSSAEDGDRNQAANTTSPYNFVKLWQLLRDGDSSLVDHARLLKNLSPSELPRVLGNKLDGGMLATFLRCLHEHFDVEQNCLEVAEYLAHLSQVQRFHTVSLMLDADDREVACRLLRKLKDAGFALGRFESAFPLR